MAKQKTKKRTATKKPKHDMSDALALLTDEDLRASLTRRRATLIANLADFATDMTMPDFANMNPVQRANWDRSRAVVEAAIKDIDRRLAASSDVLRAFSRKASVNGAPPAAEDVVN